MKIKDKFKEIASYQSSNFQDWFGDMEFVEKETKLYGKKLGRDMLDKKILAEFKPTEIEPGELFHFLKNDAKKKDWMLFYIKDEAGVLRAAYVGWDVDGWGVRADSVESPVGWDGECRVFSRNSFETPVAETLNVGHLCPSCGEKIIITLSK